MSENGKVDEPMWAIVEVMGHKRYCGKVSEQVIAGTAFLRIDVPAVDDEPAFTKLIGGASVYAITPTTEEIARIAAKRTGSQPIDVYLGPLAKAAATPLLPDSDYEPHQGGYYREEDD